jgi:hypothetical protein
MASPSKFAHISNMAMERELYMDTDSEEEISINIERCVAAPSASFL